MFSGSITALVTPMQVDGEIDYACLRKLVDRQIAAGTSALVVNGTTGEAPTLSREEQLDVLGTVIEQAAHRVPVIAGTGNYATRLTIELTKAAMQSGADACLLIAPYYNKPTQQGLYEHYKAVAEAVPLPLLLYNVPGRTGCDMLPATVERLSHVPNIVGLKECVMTLTRIEELIERCGERLNLLTGNDEDALPSMKLGFKGVISVTANIAPKTMANMCQAALTGDFVRARALNQQLSTLHQKLFIESNPIPCKWLMHDMGLIPDGIRLPLTPLAEQFHADVRQALQASGQAL